MKRIFETLAVAAIAAATFEVFAVTPSFPQEMTPALKALVADANKEGQVDVAWSSTTLGGADGAKAFEEHMAKLYGAKVKVRWNPGRSMPEVGNEIAMRYTSGLPSPTDVYYGYSRNMADLLKYQVFMDAPWSTYSDRMTGDVLEQGNTFVKVQSSYVGIAVSNKFAPYMPKSLDDLLKPEWTGKLATTAIGAGFEMLASKDMMGPERSIDWAKKMSGQIGGLMRCSDMERLLSGEFVALVTDCGSPSVLASIQDGAPLTRVVPQELSVVSYYYLAVPKNSVHPNAAKLLTVYLLSQDGQKVIGDMRGGMDLSSLPGSKSGEVIHKLEADLGKKFVSADIAWQVSNEEGNKAQRTIKDILTQGKKE